MEPPLDTLCFLPAPFDDVALLLRRLAKLSPPLPPPTMRQLVGPTDDAAYDNPGGGRVFPYIPLDAYQSVFDFGCGCGRVARQLIQQKPRPKRYVGIDLHRGMIKWCTTNLAPFAPGFSFYHHNVFNISLNPEGVRPGQLAFPAADGEFSLVNAWSVFTHLSESAAAHYVHECARILCPDGLVHSTWFLFDKTDFPMMQSFQNALFINDVDPTNAVIFDRQWVRRTAASAGLVIYQVIPPAIRGFQWTLLMARPREGLHEASFPIDTAPADIMRPPLMPADASAVGLAYR